MPNPRRYAPVRWPSSRGTTGRFATDQVAGFAWNRWPESVEYTNAAALRLADLLLIKIVHNFVVQFEGFRINLVVNNLERNSSRNRLRAGPITPPSLGGEWEHAVIDIVNNEGATILRIGMNDDPLSVLNLDTIDIPQTVGESHVFTCAGISWDNIESNLIINDLRNKNR